MYIKAQEFLHLRKSNMIVREFSIKLNSLAKYALRVASLEKGKLEVFLSGLRSNIIKNVMIGNNSPKSLSEALGKTLSLEAMRH